MRKSLIAIACLWLSTMPAGAQQPAGVTAPKTKLEAFTLRTGAIIIMAFSPGISVTGTSGYCGVDLEIREFTDAATGRKESGVLVRVREVGGAVGRVEREHSSFVDYDEISSLIKAIEYLSKLELRTATSLDNFQAEYRTKGDLRIASFSSPSPVAPAGLQAFVESGRIQKASCILEIPILRELREAVIKAQTKLDSLKPAGK